VPKEASEQRIRRTPHPSALIAASRNRHTPNPQEFNKVKDLDRRKQRATRCVAAAAQRQQQWQCPCRRPILPKPPNPPQPQRRAEEEGDLPEAETQLLGALAVDPDHTKSNTELHHLLCKLRRRMKKYKEALEVRITPSCWLRCFYMEGAFCWLIS